MIILFKMSAKKFVKDCASQFQKSLMNFHKLHAPFVLYGIVTVRLGYHRFCAKYVRKMLMGLHKTQRMASDFVDIFRALPQRRR
jgi:hypothetical protein